MNKKIKKLTKTEKLNLLDNKLNFVKDRNKKKKRTKKTAANRKCSCIFLVSKTKCKSFEKTTPNNMKIRWSEASKKSPN